MGVAEELRTNFLFEGIPPETLREIAQFCRLSNVPKKSIIFNEGDKAEGFYLLLSGKVVIFKVSEEGKEQILHIIEPGQTFAEAVVFGGGSYPAFAKTVDESRLILIPKREFLNKLTENPQIAIKMLSSMSTWLKRMVDLVEDLSLKDVETRFLGFLRSRIERKGFTLAEGTEIELDIEKSVIASKINAVPETFSRMLRRLADKGVIEVKKNKIKIISPKDLEDIF